MPYRFVELLPKEFEKFEQQHALGTYTQSIAQYHVLSARGRHPYLIGVKHDERVVAAALVLTETTRFGSVFLFDRGPLIDFNDRALCHFFVTKSRQFAKQRGALYIEWTPNVTYLVTNNKGDMQQSVNDSFMATMSGLGFQHEHFTFGMSTTGSPSWECVKDISDLSDEKSILKSYSKNVQYYLKKNKQFGIQLRELSRTDLPSFKALTESTAERLHYHDKDLAFYESIYDIYGDDAIFVFAELNFETYIASERDKVSALEQKLVKINEKISKYPNQDKFKRQYHEFEDQKQHHSQRIQKATKQFSDAGQATVVVAGALFIKQPQEMTYLYSGTYEAYKDYYGPYQIQDMMIRRAVALGIPRYNFYGISGRFDGSDGVLGFKTAFEGHARQLVGRFILPVRPLKYKAYRALKKITGRA